MKIYGVCVGNDYDGFGIQSPMFKLRLDAMMECHALANKYNEEYDNEYKLESNDRYDDGWWRDGSDYIHVIEYELIL